MFDISNSNQSETIETSIKAALYKSVNNTSKNARWVRLTGLGIGIVSAVLKIARQVALIAENILKGLGNVFGYFFVNQCSFQKGLYQLLIETPKNVIILPFSVISASFEIFTHTVQIASDPVQFSYEKWCENDPVEENHYQQSVQRYQQSVQRKEFLAAQSKFNQEMSLYNQDNNDVHAITYLAKAYQKGYGVQQDTTQSIKFYEEAAQLGDIGSIIYLADAYCEGKIVEKAPQVSFDYYMKAAKMGNINCIYEVGQCYRYGFGTTKDLDKAVKWYEGAKKGGHEKAWKELSSVISEQDSEKRKKTLEKFDRYQIYLGVKSNFGYSADLMKMEMDNEKDREELKKIKDEKEEKIVDQALKQGKIK